MASTTSVNETDQLLNEQTLFVRTLTQGAQEAGDDIICPIQNDDSYNNKRESTQSREPTLVSPSTDHSSVTSVSRLVSNNETSEYLTLAVAIALGLVSGTLYGYGRYARDLQQALSLSHLELERLGILLDTGNYIGHPVIGYIYDRFGPHVSCLCGAGVVMMSYGMIHWIILVSSPSVSPPGTWCICLLGGSFFFVGFGSGLGYTAALGSTNQHFSKTPYRSLAIGIVASGYGLCSTLVGITYNIMGLRYFFLFWAILVTSVNLWGVTVFWPKDRAEEAQENQEQVQPDIDPQLIITLHNSRTQRDPLFPTTENEDDSKTDVHVLEQTTPDRLEPLLENCEDSNEASLGFPRAPPLWPAIRSLDFWMLFFAFACCTGCGLFVINNISTMVQSIGGHDSLSGHLVVLLSFSNCFGRILIGCLAGRQRQSQNHELYNLGLFGLASLTMAGALFLSSIADLPHARPYLFATVSMVALSYGGVWVLIVGILSDWFGTSDFGKNYGLIACGPALSGMVFNEASAWMYEYHSSSTNADQGNACVGTRCYQGSFLLTGCAASLSVLLLCCLAYQRQSTI